MERRGLALRCLADLAEHLARARLVEPGLGHHQAHGFEQPGHADGVELGRQHGLLPRRRHEGHRRQVVDLGRLHGLQQVDERQLIQQVGLTERDTITQVRDALEVLGARAPHHAGDLVPALEQQLREVRAILAGDAGDERAPIHRRPAHRVDATAVRSRSP
jgi:hypothetical protein